MPLAGEEDSVRTCALLASQEQISEESQEGFMLAAAPQRSLLAIKWPLFFNVISLYFTKLLYGFSCRPRVCSVPGCFLQDLSNPSSDYVKYFKKNKEELAQKLFSLYNSTIFEQKVGFKTKTTILKCWLMCRSSLFDVIALYPLQLQVQLYSNDLVQAVSLKRVCHHGSSFQLGSLSRPQGLYHP